MFPVYHPSVAAKTPFLFFTGKGGVGKTSTASATAVALADEGKRILLVSTDPASNLQDVFNEPLTNTPKKIEGVPGLFACNLDPEEAASRYRESVVGPYREKLPEAVLNQMEEQLSGACTVEIAAFDEFTNLLANKELLEQFDHILFDTAPTGHTLRLLKLPTAWSGFLDESTHGASCLGPLAGLDAKKGLYAKTVEALADPLQTTLVLVTRPDAASFKEAERASVELNDTGINNQLLIVNGLYRPGATEDPTANAFAGRQQAAVVEMPALLKTIETYHSPFVSYPLTGIESLRKLYQERQEIPDAIQTMDITEEPLASLNELTEQYSRNGVRLLMTMGKGGVGKTSIAALLAVGLSEKGRRVHLTTTDPADHLTHRFKIDDSELLTVSRIDPALETEKYKAQVLEKAGELDEEALAYLEEDLRSPCTEEIAVFHAFAEVVSRADDEIVIIDTAPTGHTLLLLDAAHSYHRELERSTGVVPDHVLKLLPRLRHSEETEVLLVTLPEATPVHEATRLQEDLKRADIQAQTWIINQSLYGTGTTEPVLSAKAASEREWIEKVSNNLAKTTALIPWQAEELTDYENMKKIIIT